MGFEYTVMGGKGKFKGATGGGKVTYTWGDTNFGDRLAFTDEAKVTIP